MFLEMEEKCSFSPQSFCSNVNQLIHLVHTLHHVIYMTIAADYRSSWTCPQSKNIHLEPPFNLKYMFLHCGEHANSTTYLFIFSSFDFWNFWLSKNFWELRNPVILFLFVCVTQSVGRYLYMRLHDCVRAFLFGWLSLLTVLILFKQTWKCITSWREPFIFLRKQQQEQPKTQLLYF